jgi:prolyl 4-hydroxylase
MYHTHLKQVFSPQWCEDILHQAHLMGFEKAEVNNYGKLERLDHIRNNDKVQWDDTVLASEVARVLQQKADSLFPFELNNLAYQQTGSRFRIYRYEPGQYFKPHRDGHVSVNNLESQVTALIYLNTTQGGETILMPKGFAMKDWWIHIQPEIGDVLLFEHDFWHEGRPVIEGEKYVLRTDLFYEAPGSELA